MYILRNKIIPFPGYKCINLFGILFVRENAVLTTTDIVHETIHTKQMQEMAYIFFYLWYSIEWLVKLVHYRFDSKRAYKSLSFEREAYANETVVGYPENRKHYCWIKLVSE